MITTLTFTSAGTTCAATYYRPDSSHGLLPWVVMGHGFTGTQELMEPYAKKFVKAGLAVLTFDYRNFGKSEGQPRQIVSVPKQMTDWHEALRLARTLDGVNPNKIALWGSSLSGGYVINLAAEDPAIAAVIAQVPSIDKSTKGMSAEADAKMARLGLTKMQVVSMYIKVVLAAVYDALRGALGMKNHSISASSESQASALRPQC